ncbi:hypothetical protein [Aridibaculum aurantiacum]|uniref:hypothetical protein n=1 Tax=Aridibaculum aurantiacum TaxID=2810307 RepID=UPI001A95CD9E|nr:hypothetical protein [Aridibaculum aurantiacum]
MNSRKNTFSVAKFLKIAAVVTLIIAAIEIPIIYFYFSKKNDTDTAGIAATTIATAKVDTLQSKFEQQKTVVTEAPAQDIKPQQQVEVSATNAPVTSAPLPVVAEVKPALQPVKADTAKPASKAEQPVEKPVKKVQLTEERMQQVLSQLNAQREKSALAGKCVKIRQTANSNVQDGFKIAGFLKSNGYIISGRETVSKTIKGIAVTAGADCMAVTIGSL